MDGGLDELDIDEKILELLDEGDYSYRLEEGINLVEVFAALEEENLFLIN